MDQRRKQYATEIHENIIRMEAAQKRDEESLKNLRNLNLPVELFQKKQATIKTAIEKRQENMFNLEERKRDFLAGRLDQEISQELDKNTKDAKNRAEAAIKRKKEISKLEEGKKVRDIEQQFKNEERNTRKDHAFYYRLHCKANETLPDYMRKNLADMPNNKGYIWRDCWFFGDKPTEQGQPTIMFEKKRDGIMHIHEIDFYEHRIFEKVGKERKTLLSVKSRKIKSSRFNKL